MRASERCAAIVAAHLLMAGTPGPYEATRARPLFSPTRRPPVAAMPEPVTVSPAAASLPVPSLSGVILGDGVGIALFRRPGSDPVRVPLGGLIDGWTVSDIRRREVTLRRDDRTETVELSK